MSNEEVLNSLQSVKSIIILLYLLVLSKRISLPQQSRIKDILSKSFCSNYIEVYSFLSQCKLIMRKTYHICISKTNDSNKFSVSTKLSKSFTFSNKKYHLFRYKRIFISSKLKVNLL